MNISRLFVLPLTSFSLLAGAVTTTLDPVMAQTVTTSSASIPIFVPMPEQQSVIQPTTGAIDLNQDDEAAPDIPDTAANWIAFAQPTPEVKTPMQLWATYYYVHKATPVKKGYRLLDIKGRPLGPKLTRRDWCYAAVQGVVQISKQDQLVTYGFAGRGSRQQADCSPYFKGLSKSLIKKVGRARFRVASVPYGYASGKFRATPFRTIAVDRSRIPFGSVVFIPEAKGVTVTLPSGEQVVHDGYFYAADVGSAIKGNHIDVFIGPTKTNPFDFVKSTSQRTFQAFIVEDPEIKERFRVMHEIIR
ncbi:MAG TPA: hypothetical protein IGS53_29520 [Leptolyngbyaceae cyanobacterium M33_DOE_097]|uniref:3D domain-containing protein n=1 Tax=Oscillatoriales cyanobacterium SpSt-418 TaxID=2282169 RepID=A0A7C3KBZ4_9CYAN|nr:hypothetical protein [Leptolyngbyaceae cyanobacterium M33_DOE_097]